MTLMEDQVVALADVWGFIREPDRYPFHGNFPKDAWEVLARKGYRRKIWSTNSQTFKATATYAGSNSALLSSIRQKQPLDNLDGESRAALNSECKATADLLSIVLERVITQTSEFNDIERDSDNG